MSTARVLALLEILQAGGTKRVADLADRLGVDERTVRRYAEHLADLDIPIRSIRGRYGGYRLAPGYRMPPLMLTDDEAVAVAIGLHAGPDSLAADNALAKLRRVLPTQLADRLGAFLETASFTTTRGAAPADTGVLLTIAQAARDEQSVEITYTDRHGHTTTRSITPYGVVGHGDHWYVATADRTFRLDRIAEASLPKATASKRQEAPERREPDVDPARAVLHALATTPWAYQVSVRVQATVEELQRRLPPGLAVLTPLENEVRVELRAERLDWVPALLAGLDLPFVIEQPDELRQQVRQLADRLRRISSRSVDVGL